MRVKLVSFIVRAMVKKPIHPTIQSLLADIEAYRLKAGLDRTAFGRKVVRDGNFISRLENGRQPSLFAIDKVRRYLDRNTKAVVPKGRK